MKPFNAHTHIRNIRDLTTEPANGPITLTFLPESERKPKSTKVNPYFKFRPGGGKPA